VHEKRHSIRCLSKSPQSPPQHREVAWDEFLRPHEHDPIPWDVQKGKPPRASIRIRRGSYMRSGTHERTENQSFSMSGGKTRTLWGQNGRDFKQREGAAGKLMGKERGTSFFCCFFVRGEQFNRKGHMGQIMSGEEWEGASVSSLSRVSPASCNIGSSKMTENRRRSLQIT